MGGAGAGGRVVAEALTESAATLQRRSTCARGAPARARRRSPTAGSGSYVDRDVGERILGDGAAVRDHQGDRLADITHLSFASGAWVRWLKVIPAIGGGGTSSGPGAQ